MQYRVALEGGGAAGTVVQNLAHLTEDGVGGFFFGSKTLVSSLTYTHKGKKNVFCIHSTTRVVCDWLIATTTTLVQANLYSCHG